MVVGVLRVEVRLPGAQSLKDKRSGMQRFKEQLRGRFNIAVAEVDPNELWQRATVGISSIGETRAYVEKLLAQVTAWLRETRLVELIRVEEDYF